MRKTLHLWAVSLGALSSCTTPAPIEPRDGGSVERDGSAGVDVAGPQDGGERTDGGAPLDTPRRDAGPLPGGLAVRVEGDHLINASGAPLQLRGVNVSGLEFVAAQGWSAANPWGASTGDPTPNWATIGSWDTNAVRLPLNQSSWLGTSCDGSYDPDPGDNYRSTVASAVADATEAGFYVILDLHISAPNGHCAQQQGPYADRDSIRVWEEIATEFGHYPNVIFELFNEPYLEEGGFVGAGVDPWIAMRDGTTLHTYIGADGSWITADWETAGSQELLDAIRGTGATNVVLVSGLNWSRNLTGWLRARPTDSLAPSQIAAVWHAYPFPGGTDRTPDFEGVSDLTTIEGILAAGFPVVATEIGDVVGRGAGVAPFAQRVLPWADEAGVSYLGWTWNPWPGDANVLIRDASGAPSEGFGEYFQAHLSCAGAAVCP